MTTVAMLPLSHVDEAWPVLEPMLARATKRSFGRLTPTDVRRMVLSNPWWQVWVGFDQDPLSPECVIVTCVVEYPRRRCFQLVAAAGNNFMAYAPQFAAMLTDFARNKAECQIYELMGRPGWLRVISRYVPLSRATTCVEGVL